MFPRFSLGTLTFLTLSTTGGLGNDSEKPQQASAVQAISDDGKRLALPLTVNPIPGQYADRTVEPAKSHFEVWTSLVREFE